MRNVLFWKTKIYAKIDQNTDWLGILFLDNIWTVKIWGQCPISEDGFYAPVLWNIVLSLQIVLLLKYTILSFVVEGIKVKECVFCVGWLAFAC